MRPALARFRSGRLIHLVAFWAMFLGLSGQSGLLGTPNEFGHPIKRDFPPGKSVIGHLCLAVTQDADGFIYIANQTEVRFFDGTTWQLIKLPTESAGVRKFAVTTDGTIYVGGAGVLGNLRPSKSGKEFVSLAGRLPPSELGCSDIFDVLAVGNTVYFADEEKILIWRDQRFTLIPCRAPPHSRGARLHRVGDAVYVTALDRPLCRLVHDRLEIVADDPVLRQNQIILVEAGPGDALRLLTAEKGFFQLAAGHIAPLSIAANRWLAGKGILRAKRLADGSIVIAFTSVSGDGGMRFAADGEYVGPLDQSAGLYVKTLRDFFYDREGGLWLGTETGLIRLVWPYAATVFDGVNGLGSGAVVDVSRHQGVLYAATNEGVYRLAPSDAAGRCARFERILHYPAYALISHPSGLLALGYTNLFLQTAAGFTAVAKLPPGGGILHLSNRDPDRLWLGTSHGIQSIRYTASGWRDEGVLPGFNENCHGLTEAPDGSLWVSAPGRSLFHVDVSSEGNALLGANRFERFSGGQGLPEHFQRANTAEWNGEPIIVLDTSTRPFRYDSASRRFLPFIGTESWPADASDGGWLPSAGGNPGNEALWLSGSTGIFRAGKQGPPQRLPQLVKETVGHVSQMREEDERDGAVLWICGTKGLVRLEVARAFPAPVPFVTLLRAAGVSPGDRLDPGAATISFHYVAFRHQIANSVTYQTRLVGLDRNWTSWSPARERALARLPAGDYRFEVRARDADDQLSEPASLAFTVLPPWWLTVWALAGYVATGSGLIAGAVGLRTRVLRRQAKQLEVVIIERTSELAQKNLELVRLHQIESEEKIAARLAEEKARLEVLRYQLNPHFLYNTLASISASLPAGLSTPRTMIERLAEFCRLTLHRADDRNWTTLGEELRLLHAYLEIEQSRWGDLLDIEIACDDALTGERIPHFLLLPLVENALKYGRATSLDRVGVRLATSRGREGTLILEVANTGKWVEPNANKTVSSLGIGLENLRERLNRFYPRSHELNISHAGGWVRVTLCLNEAGQERDGG